MTENKNGLHVSDDLRRTQFKNHWSKCFRGRTQTSLFQIDICVKTQCYQAKQIFFSW